MKFSLSFKTPDVLQQLSDSEIRNIAESLSIGDTVNMDLDECRQIVDRWLSQWVTHKEYIQVTFDTTKVTAEVN